MGPSELAVKRAAAKVPPVKPKRTRRKKVDA
jgi:hypothetical protein